MRKNIVISIPDNLSKEKEIIAIAKKLTQKTISGNGRNNENLRIGTQVDFKDLQTTITINRVSSDKPIEMITCNVCGCEYQNNTAKSYYHNYGGRNKKVLVCSNECADLIVGILGNRASKTKSKLKPIILY